MIGSTRRAGRKTLFPYFENRPILIILIPGSAVGYYSTSYFTFRTGLESHTITSIASPTLRSTKAPLVSTPAAPSPPINVHSSVAQSCYRKGAFSSLLGLFVGPFGFALFRKSCHPLFLVVLRGRNSVCARARVSTGQSSKCHRD